MHQGELEGATVECLEGCGFCCTFPPEVAADELARLRKSLPAIPTVRASGRVRLALQSGCGACTLLSRQQCTAYEDRPRHCRYFPFHVHFGRRVEVVLNRSCRGVTLPHTWIGPTRPGPLPPPPTLGPTDPPRSPLVPRRNATEAFAAQVRAVAPAGEMERHTNEARDVHAEFERRARAAGAWDDVDAAILQALELPWFDQAPSPEAWSQALAPFAAAKVVQRPFYLDQDLRWLTFQRDGLRLEVLEMQEDGSLTAEGTELRPAAAAPPPAARAGLLHALRFLSAREAMAGQVFDLVDASGYRLGVAKAARTRVAQLVAELGVRVQVLQALRVPAEELASEALRFQDSAFLDAPTIGGWL